MDYKNKQNKRQRKVLSQKYSTNKFPAHGGVDWDDSSKTGRVFWYTRLSHGWPDKIFNPPRRFAPPRPRRGIRIWNNIIKETAQMGGLENNNDN